MHRMQHRRGLGLPSEGIRLKKCWCRHGASMVSEQAAAGGSSSASVRHQPLPRRRWALRGPPACRGGRAARSRCWCPAARACCARAWPHPAESAERHTVACAPAAARQPSERGKTRPRPRAARGGGRGRKVEPPSLLPLCSAQWPRPGHSCGAAACAKQRPPAKQRLSPLAPSRAPHRPRAALGVEAVRALVHGRRRMVNHVVHAVLRHEAAHCRPPSTSSASSASSPATRQRAAGARTHARTRASQPARRARRARRPPGRGGDPLGAREAGRRGGGARRRQAAGARRRGCGSPRAAAWKVPVTGDCGGSGGGVFFLIKFGGELGSVLAESHILQPGGTLPCSLRQALARDEARWNLRDLLITGRTAGGCGCSPLGLPPHLLRRRAFASSPELQRAAAPPARRLALEDERGRWAGRGAVTRLVRRGGGRGEAARRGGAPCAGSGGPSPKAAKPRPACLCPPI